MKRKNYSISNVAEQQIKDLMRKLGIKGSDVIRRAVELLWIEKIDK